MCLRDEVPLGREGKVVAGERGEWHLELVWLRVCVNVEESAGETGLGRGDGSWVCGGRSRVFSSGK